MKIKNGSKAHRRISFDFQNKIWPSITFIIMLFGLCTAAAFSAAATTTAAVQAATGNAPDSWTRIQNGIVAVCGAIALAVIGALAKDATENKFLKVIVGKRRRAIRGKWEGPAANFLIPDDQPAPMEFTFNADFRNVRRKIVKGTGDFKFNGTTYTVDMRGGFYNDSYLKLEYWHPAPIIGFGYMILKLDDHAKSLVGKVVAYGARSGKIVVGKVSLVKVSDA